VTQTSIDLATLKAGGIIKQRQEDYFLVRLKATLGELTSDQLGAIGEIARQYGQGKIHITTRQGIEIPWVRWADVQAVSDRLSDVDIPLNPINGTSCVWVAAKKTYSLLSPV
jgi:sulfite reductase beta subunit-like hemoprotein